MGLSILLSMMSLLFALKNMTLDLSFFPLRLLLQCLEITFLEVVGS